MVYGYERNEFYRLKRCLRVSKTQDQHQLFIIFLSLIIFIEKVTYTFINLKYQNSLNIGHNANPTFSLMNNQSQSSDNIRSFIVDAKSHVYSSTFFLWLSYSLFHSFLTCLQSRSSFFQLSLKRWNFVLSLLFTIGSLLSSSKKISYLPPVWGVILVRVFFLKNILSGSKWNCK